MPSALSHRGILAAILAVAMAAIFTVDASEASAQVEGKRVEFTVTVDSASDAGDEDSELRVLRQRERTKEVISRIEHRLDAIGIPSHRVRAVDEVRIRVTVYGDHDARAIKSTVIPSGSLEIRPVMVDGSHWIEIAAELPEGVELRPEPGAFRTDRLFLFSHSAQALRRAINMVDRPDSSIKIFPHNDGWRAVELAAPAATERDIENSSLKRTPAGIPYVRAILSSDAAQTVRSAAAGHDSRHLAIVLDGEVVALQRFSRRNFSESLDIDPPAHLRSSTARTNWSYQVGGRLAAAIPLRLAELQE